MIVSNWVAANTFPVSELEIMGAGWAVFGGDIIPDDVFLCVERDWAVVYWDGFGCDAESMPPNMLYVSVDDGYIFAREFPDGASFEAVRDFMAAWDPTEMANAWDADSEKFESESGWVVVS